MAEKAVKSGDADEAHAQLSAALARLEGTAPLVGEARVQDAEVRGRLGQVCVFRGELAAGLRLMRAAAAAWEELGAKDRSTELELAVQAVEARVERGVETAAAGEARARALRVRAGLRQGHGDDTGARADLAAAWDTPALPDALRCALGLELGALLLRVGAAERARAVLVAARALAADGAPRQAIDALLLRVGSDGAPA